MNTPIPMPPRGLYEFGPFRLDPAKHLLQKNSKPLQLPPKAFEILVLLVERKGVLIAKGDLLHAVWPDTFVEENNLTQYVSMLRKVLGDGVDDQKYIQTVPKLGYRFVSDVREIDGEQMGLLLAKHTRTRIVVREEKEEEVADFEGEFVAVIPAASAQIQRAKLESIAGADLAGTLPRKRPRAWFWSLSFSVIVFGTAAALVFFREMRARLPDVRSRVALQQTVKPRKSVAVLGFKNLAGRGEDDWLTGALTEMLTTELAAGGKLRVVSGEDVNRIRADLNLAEPASLELPALTQIKNRVGADITVTGSYVQLGKGPEGQLRLDLQLQDTTTGETVFSNAETGTVGQLFALVSRSGAQLRAKLGAPLVTSAEAAEVQAAFPSTPETARLYSEGLSKLRAADAPAAQKLLTKAVTLDPNFALGHSALAAAWSALGYDEKAKTEARRALDLSSNLSRQEHLSIAGQYNELIGDWDRAVESYQKLYNLYPDSVDYGVRLAAAEASAGKGKEALTTLDKLRKLPSPIGEVPQIDLAEASAADSVGDFKLELETSERAIQKGENLGERLLVARAWVKKSWALLHIGQEKEAIEGLQEAKKLFAEAGDLQGVGATLHILGDAQSENGDYTQATQNYQEALAIFRRIGDRRAIAFSINGLAIVAYERGDYAQAKRYYEEYLAIEQEVGSKMNTAGALGNLANLAEAQGDLAEARKMNEESIKIFEEIGNEKAKATALGNLAELLYEQGDLRGAKKKFQEALEIKQKIGYQRGIAYDLSGLSEILRAEGDLAAARTKQQESLAIRTQLGEKHNAAASRLYLAMLSLAELKTSDAEKLALESGEVFKQEKSQADEAAAEVVLAESFLVQGKISEAQEAVGRARALSRHTTNPPLDFDISIASARISVAGKKSPSPSATAKAEENLESSLAMARKSGYLEYEYKIALALGEIELESGSVHEGRARLAAVAGDAKSKGFGQMARNATQALESKPLQQK